MKKKKQLKIDKISFLLPSQKKTMEIVKKNQEEIKNVFLEKTLFYKKISEKINFQKKKTQGGDDFFKLF